MDRAVVNVGRLARLKIIVLLILGTWNAITSHATALIQAEGAAVMPEAVALPTLGAQPDEHFSSTAFAFQGSMVVRTLKGDRLSPSLRARNPLGCDTAFSPLAGSSPLNITVRCLS